VRDLCELVAFIVLRELLELFLGQLRLELPHTHSEDARDLFEQREYLLRDHLECALNKFNELT
jgi:hypothetical protein